MAKKKLGVRGTLRAKCKITKHMALLQTYNWHLFCQQAKTM